jgi:antitoxin component of MazEF toxin-antitoxin module
MKRMELKVARIGNSRGVRIPAATLERYHIGSTVVMEERSDGILLRPRSSAAPKLSWEDTAREMAAEAEDWREWDVTSADGLDTVAWEGGKSRRVAETTPSYRKPGRSQR